MPTKAEKGRDLVQRVFGGAFYQQGRGFYSGLELFAILRGELLLEKLLGEGTELVLPRDGVARYLRPTHDHARRLLVSDSEVVPGVFNTPETREAVQSLLRGLEAPVPGRRRAPDKWQLRHLYPYPAEAIHYDAVERRGKVSVERYQFRGAGGFAHKVLRSDDDLARLSETRAAFRGLLEDSESAVGQLLNAISVHDDQRPAARLEDLVSSPAFEDEVERRSFSPLGAELATLPDSRWTVLLREGTHRLLTRDELTGFDRIESLLHWVPFCIAMHQLAMALRLLGKDENRPIVFDAGFKSGPVRAAARSHFGQATSTIRESLQHEARHTAPEVLSSGAAWWKGPRSFFTTTLFAVGASNANTGQRHFELRPQLIQTIVRALVDVPVPHEVFTRELLGERLSVVCDPSGADMISDVVLDRRDLKSNGQALVARIDEIGMLRALSDATRMVGIHG